MSNSKDNKKYIGIIPCAGIAKRVAPMPCSKEIYPVGFHKNNKLLERRSKAVCSYLLENLETAGISEAFFIIRKDKVDIIDYLGNGKAYGINIAYLAMDHSPNVPFTINEARNFIQDSEVAFGFPDIIIKPKDAFVHLLARKTETNSDLVLGLFPAKDKTKVDMVEIDKHQQVLGVYPKPINSTLKFTWLIAVWSPRFTKFINSFLNEHLGNGIESRQSALINREYYLGDVMNAAVKEGMVLQSVVIPDGEYIDIGTPADMMQAVSIYARH